MNIDEVPGESEKRYLLDKEYAARIDQAIRDTHVPIEGARLATDGLPIDPRWADVNDDDLFE